MAAGTGFGRGTARPDVARFLVGTLSLALLSALGTLLVWAVGYPVLRGWSPVAIVSGSMAPAIDEGDVMVAAPADDARLKPGAVIVFDDPARRGLVTHRIVDEAESGELVTRGDGNAEADSSMVDPAAVRGIGRLIVPFVGLPQAWMADGEWVRLAVAALLLVAALWTCRWGLLDEFDPWRVEPAGPTAPAPAEWAMSGGPALASLVLVAALVGPSVSEATFVDPSDSPTNSITAAASFP